MLARRPHRPPVLPSSHITSAHYHDAETSKRAAALRRFALRRLALRRLTLRQLATYTIIPTIFAAVKYSEIATEDWGLDFLLPFVIYPLLFMLHTDLSAHRPKSRKPTSGLAVYCTVLTHTLYWGVAKATSLLETWSSRDTFQTPLDASCSQQQVLVSPGPKFTTRQMISITFTLSFFLISEIEYWTSRLFNYPPIQYPSLDTNLRYADFYPPFSFTQLFFWYARLYPSDMERARFEPATRSMWSKTPWRFASFGAVLYTLSILSLPAIHRNLHDLINPGLGNERTQGHDIIFTGHSVWVTVAVNLLLMRTVRVVYAELIWWAVEGYVRFVESRMKEALARKEKEDSI